MQHGIKWQLWLFPNGDVINERGQRDILLYCTSLPIEVESILVHIEIKFDGTTLNSDSCHYSEPVVDGWYDAVLTTQDISIWLDGVLFTDDLIRS